MNDLINNQPQKEELKKCYPRKNPVLIKEIVKKTKIEKKTFIKELEYKFEILDQGIISEVEYQSNKAFLDEGNLLEHDISLDNLENDIKKVEFGKYL